MIWFIIKGLHPGICLENLETHNMCHSWRAAMQIKSSEKYCICFILCNPVFPNVCLRKFVNAEHAGHLIPKKAGTGTVEIYSNLPSSRTTSGTLSSSSRQALVIPLAIMAQLTIPPKILTRMASTWNKK